MEIKKYTFSKNPSIVFKMDEIENWTFKYKGEEYKLDAKKFLKILKKFA